MNELNKQDKEVTIIGILSYVLNLAFDKELSIIAEEVLLKKGVKLKTNDGVKEIKGDTTVTGVELNSGEIVLKKFSLALEKPFEEAFYFAIETGLKKHNYD